MIPDGKPDEISEGVQFKLAHDGRAMCLDRLHTQVQTRGNSFVAVPFSKKLDDLALA